MKTCKGLLSLTMVLVLALAATAPAQDAADATAKKEKKKKTFIKDKVKDYTKFEGLFTLYQNPEDGSTYLRIEKDQIGKEFIYFSHIQDGVVGARHFRGQYRGSKIFRIKKHFNRLEFIAENTSYYFDEQNAISRAKDANISHAILTSQKIEAMDSLESAYLVSANSLFLKEDLARVKPTYSKNHKGYKLGSLSKDKTKYRHIKSYPQNTDVVVEYVYESKAPTSSPGAGTTDARFVSTRVQHSFIAVPYNDFKPRMDDPRIGYFTRQITDLTSQSATPYRDFIHRWNLKKKNPSARLSEPVEPIVWWIENTTPREIRGTVRDAVLAWNVAFEKAGFKNAVVVKVQPDDAEWDAGDIRYNVLRWTSSPRPPFGGYGPSFVNPRTGQILGADIMLEYSFLTNRLNYDKIFATAALGMQEETVTGEDQFCMLNNHLQHSNIFGLNALNMLGSTDVEKSTLVKESIYYLMLHEVGHTLGLNHNMKSSQARSPAEINKVSLTRKTGLTGSVMDYPAINIQASGRSQGQYYTTIPGPYDLWAIEYGYSPAEKSWEREKKRLASLLSRSTDPQLVFGNDADDMRSPGKAIDPRVNIGDMSSDAIGFAINQIKLAKDVAANLRAKLARKGQSHHELRNAYFIATGQHSSSLRVISRYIGGIYNDRAFQGQPGSTKPFTPVPGAEQKRAMKALATYAFAPDAFTLPADLYEHLQPQRRGFNHFGTTEDPKIHDRILAIQRGILSHLLHKTVMKRMTDSGLYGNSYALADFMNDLTESVFVADLKSPVSDMRKNLQVEYVKRLVGIMGEKGKSQYDNISQGLAYAHLKRIRAMMRESESTDAGTSAHQTYLADLIEARMAVM